jgi:hypothetical protein
MKRARTNRIRDDDMRDYYDFSGGIRGKYAKRYSQGTNVVVLDPDVAQVFRDTESVNKTLRAVAHIIEMQSQKTRALSLTSRSSRLRPLGRTGGLGRTRAGGRAR